jgi:hypothetical protein
LEKLISSKKKNYLLIIAIATIAIITLINFTYAKNFPGGKYFLTQWIGTRTYLTQGISPYSETTLIEIQSSAYGRPAMTGEYEFRFEYPFFAISVFAPFALISDFTLARSLWMSLLELSIFGIILSSLRLTFWKLPRRTFFEFLFFGLTFYYSLRSVIDGNFMALVTLSLIGALVALRDKKLELAGLLLAITTFQIQYTILILFFVLVRCVIKQQTKVLFWFLGAMAILIGFSYLLMPDWVTQYWQQFRYIFGSSEGNSFLSILRGNSGEQGQIISVVFALLLGITLVVEWWLHGNGNYKQFIWVMSLTVLISQWIGLPADPGNFVILYPCLFFCLELLWERWKDRGITYALVVNSLLFTITWLIYFSFQNEHVAYMEFYAHYFPFPIILILLLYWSRWWLMVQKRLTLSDFS